MPTNSLAKTTARMVERKRAIQEAAATSATMPRTTRQIRPTTMTSQLPITREIVPHGTAPAPTMTTKSLVVNLEGAEASVEVAEAPIEAVANNAAVAAEETEEAEECESTMMTSTCLPSDPETSSTADPITRTQLPTTTTPAEEVAATTTKTKVPSTVVEHQITTVSIQLTLRREATNAVRITITSQVGTVAAEEVVAEPATTSAMHVNTTSVILVTLVNIGSHVSQESHVNHVRHVSTAATETRKTMARDPHHKLA